MDESLIIVSVMTNRRQFIASIIQSNTDIWEGLDAIGISEPIDEYISGKITYKVAGRRILDIIGRDTEYGIKIQRMVSETMKDIVGTVNVSITVPYSINERLDNILEGKRNKSMFISACINIILDRIKDNPKKVNEIIAECKPKSKNDDKISYEKYAKSSFLKERRNIPEKKETKKKEPNRSVNWTEDEEPEEIKKVTREDIEKFKKEMDLINGVDGK